ncbi:MAG TPA: GrpB family protein, partial [Gemmataceae bacterium]|nr:GrpB family protein [Gemmataceae bacterium]
MKIARYSPQWPIAFEKERARIVLALGRVAVRIDHHGSTAVPGLDAKPIIDIQISVRDLRHPASYALSLATLGYRHVPHAD